MKVKIKIELESFNYGGNAYKKGDVLDVTDEVAAQLTSKNGINYAGENVKSKPVVKEAPKEVVKKVPVIEEKKEEPKQKETIVSKFKKAVNKE